jgi:hypothetical protein
MNAAVATLQMAAQQQHLSGELERTEYSRIVAQLREVAKDLSAFERRTGQLTAAPVDFTEMVRVAVAAASPPANQDDGGRATLMPEGIMVEGPAHDLRDLLDCLTEYAFSMGAHPAGVRVEIKRQESRGRDACMIELFVQSPDVPDFLRRKLWDTVSKRRGEVSIVSEPTCCRIGFTLPIERRQTANG